MTGLDSFVVPILLGFAGVSSNATFSSIAGPPLSTLPNHSTLLNQDGSVTVNSSCLIQETSLAGLFEESTLSNRDDHVYGSVAINSSLSTPETPLADLFEDSQSGVLSNETNATFSSIALNQVYFVDGSVDGNERLLLAIDDSSSSFVSVSNSAMDGTRSNYTSSESGVQQTPIISAPVTVTLIQRYNRLIQRIDDRLSPLYSAHDSLGTYINTYRMHGVQMELKDRVFNDSDYCCRMYFGQYRWWKPFHRQLRVYNVLFWHIPNYILWSYYFMRERLGIPATVYRYLSMEGWKSWSFH